MQLQYVCKRDRLRTVLCSTVCVLVKCKHSASVPPQEAVMAANSAAVWTVYDRLLC